jgi:hypothetical protein
VNTCVHRLGFSEPVVCAMQSGPLNDVVAWKYWGIG